MPIFEPEKSKIKMVILTKQQEQNKVWWSPIKQNRCRSDFIIQKMLLRFAKTKLYRTTNIVQFYENSVLIYSQKIQ
jgi:hypothetical protein